MLELLLLCETVDKKLLIQLLNDFNYLDLKVLGNYLSLIADYIVTDSLFPQDTCQIARTYDDARLTVVRKYLIILKCNYLNKDGVTHRQLIVMGATIKNYKEGRKQIIFIDEFVGSAQTILANDKNFKE